MSRSSSARDIKVTLTGTKVAETGKAVRFIIHAIGVTPIEPPLSEWFPLSQVSKITTDSKNARSDVLVVSVWIMQQKDLKVKSIDPRHPMPSIEEFDNYRDYDDEE